MANKKYNVRIQNKCDTTANWNKATNFVPLKGEIVIYTDDPRKIKVGNGTTTVTNLPFATEAQISAFTGTTGSADGTSGAVPAPTWRDADKVLKSSGNWGYITPQISKFVVVKNQYTFYPTFTIPKNETSSVLVFYNGLLLTQDEHYTVDTDYNFIRCDFAEVGDIIMILKFM